jgi:WD40 repeat protein
LNRSNAAALQEVADAAHGTYVSEARKEMVSRIDGSVVRDFPVHSFAVDKAMKYAVYSFAAAGDNGPLIFDLGTFELTRLHGVPGTSLFNPIPKIDWNVAWSPDGRYLAYGTRLIEVYDPATKGSVRSWDIGRDVDSIAWSPSSTALAVLSHEGRLEKGPLSLLRALAGHPSRRYTISADVLWIDGSGQVETIVTDAFEGGEAEIEWVSDGEMTESLPPKAR